MLSVEGVEARYGKIQALHGVDVEVHRGEIATLIGANGAGKSTLMMTICGSPQAAAGRILFDGVDITRMPTYEIMRLSISQSPEGRRIFSRMTVMENLQMGAAMTDDAYFDEDLKRVFELFPRLADRRTQRGGTLSGGEQQMLAIARALMARPKLLLLDEPSLGLAPLVCQTIFSTIDAIKNDGTTVLLVEQNAHAALRCSDRGYVLETGQVILQGTSAEMARNPRVREAYLGE
jgi:branched-chain amino acid transport system ATP-binding protein